MLYLRAQLPVLLVKIILVIDHLRRLCEDWIAMCGKILAY
jgi:hypothetical protein